MSSPLSPHALLPEAPAADGPPMLRVSGDAPAGDRLGAWREHLTQVCDFAPGAPDGESSFELAMTAWHLGGLILTRVRHGSGMQFRTARHFRGDRLDHYRLTLVLDGTLCTGGPTPRIVRPGQLLLADMARAGAAMHSAGARLSVFVPRESLDELLSGPVDLHGQVLGDAMSEVVGRHLRSLLEALPRLSASQARGLVTPTLQLLASAIDAQPALRGSPRGEINVLRKACRFIEMHLQDEDLSPQAVAQAVSVSRATLYRMFEPLGGVCAFIKERRLEAIHELLRSPAPRRSMAAMAEDHGFKSAAHFSDAFLRHFGYRPSEARVRAGCSERPAPPAGAAASRGAANAELGNIVNWLKSMR